MKFFIYFLNFIHSMVQSKITLSIDTALQKKIDEKRGLIPRSAFVSKIIRERLEDE